MVRIRALWHGFKDIAILLSFITNLVLIVVLLVVVLMVFQIKAFLSDQLINGLYKSFAGLDQAHIVTTVNVSEPALPVKLNIPLQQNTTVTLTRDVQISGARTAFTLSDGTTLHGSVTIVLPQGSQLPVALDLHVPVDSSIPVNLKVPIDIPLDHSQLHDPFVNLQQVLRPYVRILGNLPNSWGEAAVYGGQLVAGQAKNPNTETQFSQNPWPGFCTGLPTPGPGTPKPTINPVCITPSPTFTATPPWTLTPYPSATIMGSGGGVSGGAPTNPGSQQAVVPGNPTLTPTHVEDFGIITPVKNP
ncbi:MAG TPA: hypothetical protein VMT34_11190 [Aggregatilineales bacterium]|nr:hypothetical protein [Aggregatilineales bacterium]